MLINDLILDPSVRAKRDRQTLMKNKPQLDDEPTVTQEVESLACSDVVSSGSVTARNIHRTAVSGESSSAVTAESHSCLDEAKESSLTASTLQARLLADVCNVIPVSKTSDTSRHKDQKKYPLPSAAAVSNRQLSKKCHSQASSAQTVDRLQSSDSSHRKTLNTRSVNSKSVAKEPPKEDKHGSSLGSSCADTAQKTVSRTLSDSEVKVVQQSGGCSAIGNSSAPAVSKSNLNTAKSAATSRSPSVSVSVDRSASGSGMTLGSVIDASMRQMVTPAVKTHVSQPTVVPEQQSKVRFQGNYQFL